MNIRNMNCLMSWWGALLLGLAPLVSAQVVTNMTTRGDGKVVVTFTSGSGTWTVPDGVTSVEVLVIGGGGAGQGYGGGGGGGGFLSTSSYAVTPGDSLNVAVGTGGAGGSTRAAATGPYPQASQAPNGNSSQFSTLLADGGLGGNWTWTSSGAGYGRGGTSGVNNQDSVGGLVADLPSNSYGSGSGVGVKGTAGTSAPGGAGLSSAITGATVWYGGGGGALVNGAGGSGGGGKGGNPAVAGTANTGGGGGAGWAVVGAAGGSGVVIIAYEQVGKTATTTILSSSLSYPTNGQTVVFTATVKANDITATGAAGNLVFSVDSVVVDTKAVSSGSASYSTSVLTPGLHTIDVSYSGDDNYVGSTVSLSQTIAVVATPVYATRGDGMIVATFTNLAVGIWTVPANVSSLDVLAVGGGGAGQGYGGGGGAGGFLSKSSYAVTPGDGVMVTVGAGGAGGSLRPAATGPYPQASPAPGGSDSQFSSLIAYGGLGGNWTWTSAGGGDGRGGTSGANNQDSVGALAADLPSNSYGSGSGVGVKGTVGTSATGGAGLSSAITGSTLWYGGGGGALDNGLGGQGGGGKGGNPAVAGTVNTGGGGGGGLAVIGAAGGSGVVIVAYPPPTSGTVMSVR